MSDKSVPTESSWPYSGFLLLILERYKWIHRRVETITFMPDQITQRRVSYDFTLPEIVGKLAVNGHVGVPLTNMKKEVLQNLSVTDATGKALSVYGSDENAKIAIGILELFFDSVVMRKPQEHELKWIKAIVHSDFGENATEEIQNLRMVFEGESKKSKDFLDAVMAFVEELADNFIFIVDLPAEVINSRSIVKVSYDKELIANKDVLNLFTLGKEYSVEKRFFPTSASSHLEIKAPESARITKLVHVNSKGDWVDADFQEKGNVRGHIGHIKISKSDAYETREIFELRPELAGIVFQTWLGTLFAFLYFCSEFIGLHKIDQLLPSIADIGPFAGVTLALPAFLLTLLVRVREHKSVRVLLRIPRAVASATALLLFISSASLVLGLSPWEFRQCLLTVGLFQGILLAWMSVVAFNIQRSV